MEAIAICLLNAYASGVHEEELAAIVARRAPGIPVCLSSALLPEIKEYERTSTTVVNAYIVPVVSRYLRLLTGGLADLGVTAPLQVMQSSGGAMGVEAASTRPIHLIESGPAAGVVGAAELSRRLDGRPLIAFDMGGTTAKAALVSQGRFDRVGSLEVGGGINVAGRLLNGGGYHVRAPPSTSPRWARAAAAWCAWTAAAACASGRRVRAPCQGRPATAAAARSRP